MEPFVFESLFGAEPFVWIIDEQLAEEFVTQMRTDSRRAPCKQPVFKSVEAFRIWKGTKRGCLLIESLHMMIIRHVLHAWPFSLFK